jgi:hypothetical protein
MKKKEVTEIGLVFVLILLGAAYVEYTDRELGNSGEITRNAYGEGSKEVELILDADSVAEDYSYTLTVEEIHVTESNARTLFEEAEQEINDTFLNDGQTMDHVSGQVHMEESYVEGKVSAEWILENYTYIDYDGNALEEKIPEEGKLLSAEVELTCGKYTENYQFSFVLYPRELTGVEQLVDQIDSYFDEQQSEEGATVLKLPESVNGITLGWSEASEHLTLKILLLEGLILVLLPLGMRSRAKENEKKRREALMLDYPEMVSKFNVLIGAGMTIKQAWHIISAQYIDKREKSSVRESIAFEEMARTDREIQDGESERIAYQGFGERIGISSYRRLVRLLISNLQKGNRGLCEQLEQEAESAFGERRMLAKRLGEEAGTKLLFPMILMLGIVMVIVIVPAMTGFTT